MTSRNLEVNDYDAVSSLSELDPAADISTTKSDSVDNIEVEPKIKRFKTNNTDTNVDSRDPCQGLRSASVENGPYQPRDIDFPGRKCGLMSRSFRAGWYDLFPWLEYSPKLDAGFCFPCR